MQVLLPYCRCWKGIDIWECAEHCCSDPFLLWAEETLCTSTDTAPALQGLGLPRVNQYVTAMIVLLGADAVVWERQADVFTDAYLRTLIAATVLPSSPEFFVELTSSIRNGVIRGDRLYHEDLRLLLETLRRYVTLDVDEGRVHAVLSATDVLLNTACPVGGDNETMRGVEAACQWFELLELEYDYRAVLVRGAVDGEVLRSGLRLCDVQQMGICCERDAAALVRVLNAHPQGRRVPGS
ncbi:hypothetical protein DQ04_01351160 [Trypanosoma grayi]|uniref:hypothetical protein n=1 Tax=Trypanosoma grayi TaxID=71804 RepID=UPI0004F41F62|nr:hypothetical protein DQ04_01351160 [Trypanosoma grayi]KEG12893.1 hypothetical protein DQ04_01351160 [Trypanosoma grayi]